MIHISAADKGALEVLAYPKDDEAPLEEVSGTDVWHC